MHLRPAFALVLCSLMIGGCGDSDSSDDAGGSAGSETAALGQARAIEDGDEAFELTPTKVYRDGSYVKVDVTVTGRGPKGFDTTGLSFLTSLFAGGQAYKVDDFPAGDACDALSATVTDGRTISGCLSFAVPDGADAEILQYDPFTGDDVTEWDLRGG